MSLRGGEFDSGNGQVNDRSAFEVNFPDEATTNGRMHKSTI